MKRKIWLGLASLGAVIMPITVTVACATTKTSMSDKESKALALFKSSTASQKIERIWLNKVIQTVGIDQTKLKDLAHFVIDQNLLKDPSFLSNLISKLLSITEDYNETTKLKDKFGEWGFNKTYYHSRWTSAKADEAIDFLLSDKLDRLGFSDQIKRNAVAQAYLGIDKAEWSKVFQKEDNKDLENGSYVFLSNVESLADTGANFPLIIHTIQNKPSLKWSIALTELESHDYIGSPDIPTMAEADIQLALSATGATTSTLADKTGYQTRNQILIKGETGLKDDTKYENFIGFGGVAQLSDGKEVLDFSLNGWKKATSFDYWQGYYQDGDLVKENINYGTKEPKANIASLTRHVGLLPTYDATNDKLVLPAEIDANVLGKLFVISDGGLYDDAVKYYTEKENPIQLEVHDDYIRDIYLDNGNKFIA